jgi:hypothetical protein
MTLLDFDRSLFVWLEAEKYTIPFKKWMLIMTLIDLLLHAILRHYQIVDESMENVHVNGNIAVNLQNLGDT